MFTFIFFGGILLIFLLATAYIKLKNIDIWFASYLRRSISNLVNPVKVEGPIDLMVLFVDHFELAGKPERLQAWLEGYPALAQKHRDADGKMPQHSWFYALDLLHEHELEALQPLVEGDYGEFELHWHHDNDTNETFVEKLQEVMPIFQKYGYMRPYQPDMPACFSFIHGNWSLDNALGKQFCGVDDEINLLKSQGCYADFTFPALFNKAQPRNNSLIFYTVDDGQSRSYDRVVRPAEVGEPPHIDEFLIFQGPLTINWRDWRSKWHPTIEDGDINIHNNHGDPKRIDCWVREAIHVQGRPEWQFVKILCHGAQDHKYVLGEQSDKMFSHFEEKYNDGERYRLHYVTAREAYNILRAAEDGKTGNPNDYRDYEIPHPLKREFALPQAQTA